LIEPPALLDLTHREFQEQRILDEEVSHLTAKFSALWNSMPDRPCLMGRPCDPLQQQKNEFRWEQLLPEPDSQSIDGDWAEKHLAALRDCVRDLVLDSVDQTKRKRLGQMLSAFSDAGDEFVRRAREFDPHLRFNSIFQALRNLWIVNSMQAAFDVPICANSSGFAYSLLYTYSDSYLDSVAFSEDEKAEFNRIFGLRLSGFDAPSRTPLESKISLLVDTIEKEYPRDLFPEVYSSLLGIHNAQKGSLRQRKNHRDGSRSDILAISVEKGGTSVVADAYLAKGTLALDEIEFAFGYGVFLQFIDDLQDVKEDLASGSETLFTLAANEGTLDIITNRLVLYLQEILSSSSPFHKPPESGVTELIQNGSVGLVLESIALNPEMFSEGFSRIAESYSPLRFEAISKLHQRRALLELKMESHERMIQANASRVPFNHPQKITPTSAVSTSF
jgi:hypothetical protein